MKENKILKWSLILSIIIVANSFFAYSLSLILDAPKYQEYCTFEQTSKIIETKELCEQEDGIWNPASRNQFIAEPVGYCDLYSKCDNEYQKALAEYSEKVFIALILIGVAVLIASYFVKNNSVLNFAFSITAVVNFIIASLRYWSFAEEYLRVIILFFALATLIYFAAKKFKNNI
jgi:hypothetical protein